MKSRMAKGLLTTIFIWVVGVELVAWWCLDMSALGGKEFWPVVLWGVTPLSIAVGTFVGRNLRSGWLRKRERS
ncbi:hypothetical protein G3N95_17150 [Paraburkholderia sp. Tr-20389]|uniref:hypothetical protein n=1 Tax=Paraburkholderia sp. Tr-20389 TaxID=2703903 RepID=UPI00198143C1|nr:hypothetical protein [Paraburkholderia sp. Tr-20389]MBN3754682.1 hypothetical protein [Paraburkholderia sp. Tr-20389]